MARWLCRAGYAALVIAVPGFKQGNFHLANVPGGNKGQGNIQLSFPAGFYFHKTKQRKTPSKLTGEEMEQKNAIRKLYTSFSPVK